MINALALVHWPLPKKKVVVTGAAGRTGELVFSALSKHSKFYPVGLVRTESDARKILKEVDGCGLENVWVCDVTKLDPNGENGLPKVLMDAEAMIICTSAKPKIKKRSLAKAVLKMPLKILKGEKAFNSKELQFGYDPGQHPEKVDYEGAITQIDLAKKLGISHVVLVSSMGGTNKDDFLNTLGKDKHGNGNGDILIWKRKAEKYLVESGLTYTIIHPGALRDTPGGVMDLKLDVDDKMMTEEGSRSISRCDVSRLCIASLTVSNSQNSSFDCVNAQVPAGSKPRCAEMALKEFLTEQPVYDYSEAYEYSI
eukprot:CAMPEP_0197233708 /NCGR_PEP_ID=MMETSP1429-20130617/1702_1 /TAXON_ID=49237 /ORGANISM="Chaetoceros  sp., Strain UNC1202" /LENGTH=310 /DNA_ID=CAMNT_0042692013 /DNA_START=104 /DNA_END=1036 /DNA_ORIENTATION=+